MQRARTDGGPPEDEDVWDRIVDLLEPLAEAVEPEPAPDSGENEGSTPSNA